METKDQSRIQEIESQLEKINAERSLLLKELKELEKNDDSFLAQLLGRKLNYKRPDNPEEKIVLFKRLFCCREDLFPRFWENNKTGKKGYSPVCSKELRLLVNIYQKIKRAVASSSSLSRVTTDEV